MARLTDQQIRFCNEYIKDLNATRAALEAGYSKKTATWQGADLLRRPHIREYIDTVLDKMNKSKIASAQEVMEYFTRVMNGEEKDQFGLEASLSERTKAAQELARRTVDLENRLSGKSDAKIEISLDWNRDTPENE